MRAAFYTLGCKVNQFETQALKELFQNAGYDLVDFDDRADVYVVNTCTVTSVSDKKSRQMISRAHAANQDAKIVVVGCYAQMSPEAAMKLPGVSLVSGTKEREKIIAYIQSLSDAKTGQINAVTDIGTERTFEALSASYAERTRAYLKIQDGCDRYCSYCIIPYARGRKRSRELPDIRAELQKLSDQGYPEVVFTGIHLMSYGDDLERDVNLIDALSLADDFPRIQRIRLGSLEPQLMKREMVDYIASNPKICRQFHLALQSGSDSVLKRMNRRYTAREYAECAAMLREQMPTCAITTDIIAGFPGETEAEFLETVSFVREIGFSRIHVFPYSIRPGTKAAAMPGQLSRECKEERVRVLIGEGRDLERQFARRFIGQTKSVLFEETSKNAAFIEGYTDEYVRVRAPFTDGAIEKILKVNIVKADGSSLEGFIQ